MGTRSSGRKPRPTALRVIEGRKPLSTNEPQPKICLVPPPDDLDGFALEEWNRVAPELYQLGLLSNIDRETLVAYCEAVATARVAQSALRELARKERRRKRGAKFEGLIVFGPTGAPYPHPLVSIRNKAQADAVRYAAEFGMTPASRSRIDVKKARTDDPTAEFFD